MARPATVLHLANDGALERAVAGHFLLVDARTFVPDGRTYPFQSLTLRAAATG
ncbi:hypothetical protein JOD67_007028 [Tenggerimyces flavus]|nr:hypothetical protein [Tenggerimyces flavus]